MTIDDNPLPETDADMCASHRRVACTIATTSHLGLAHCLADSFLQHHPNAVVFVVLVDSDRLPQGLDDRIIGLPVTELGVDALATMRNRYSVFELCNALKPSVLLHLLDIIDEDRILYLDSDLFIVDSLEDVAYRALDDAAVLLTPHLRSVPPTDEGFIQRDLAILRAGALNGGFVGARRCADTDAILRWWASRLESAGYHQPEHGMNCDQRWLDLMPGFGAAVRVAHHPGLNVAFWNLAERTLSSVEGRHFCNGEPLKFVHFSGFRVDDERSITKNWTPYTLDNRPDLADVATAYRSALRSSLALTSRVPATTTPPLTQRTNPLDAPQEPSPPGEDPNRRAKATATAGITAPDVTVVIPAYNTATTLSAAIGGVLASEGISVEVLVVDDGSTDDPARMLPADPRVSIIRQGNAGVSAARNRGLAAARTPYVVFLDADDVITDPLRLRDQVGLMASDPDVALVHSGWCTVEVSSGNRTPRQPWESVPDLSLEALVEWPLVLPSAMAWRSDAVRSIGGFDPSLRHWEDVDLTWRLLAVGHRARWLERTTTDYVRHGENASCNVDAQAQAMQVVLDRLFDRPDLDPSVAKLQRRVRYGAHVWVASAYHRAGDHDAMARHLAISAVWSDTPVHHLPSDWVRRFERSAADAGRTPFDATGLRELGQWRRLVRADALDVLIEGVAGELGAGGSSPSQMSAGTSWTAPWETSPTAGHTHTVVMPTQRVQKLDLGNSLTRDYGTHRSGWPHALNGLRDLHRDDGVLLDGFVEHTFLDNATVTRTQPWIGFLHNPPAIPHWYPIDQSPERLLTIPAFVRSLETCCGLFTLSDALRTWWADRVRVPVETVRLPTERPAVGFSFDGFRNNPTPRIVQVGTWLRKLHAIHDLPTAWLRPAMLHQHKPYIAELFEAERVALGLARDPRRVESLPFLDNDSYDELFRSNIIFLELYGASANNTIVECIVRATPVLVNPLPAVQEYLGDDYPLYFASRREAARMAEDLGRLRAGHEYLRDLPLARQLDASTFARNVESSGIYRSLPIP